jgi:fumarate reductase subunit C
VCPESNKNFQPRQVRCLQKHLLAELKNPVILALALLIFVTELLHNIVFNCIAYFPPQIQVVTRNGEKIKDLC